MNRGGSGRTGSGRVAVVTGGSAGDYMGGPSGVVQYPGGVHPAGR